MKQTIHPPRGRFGTETVAERQGRSEDQHTSKQQEQHIPDSDVKKQQQS